MFNVRCNLFRQLRFSILDDFRFNTIPHAAAVVAKRSHRTHSRDSNQADDQAIFYRRRTIFAGCQLSEFADHLNAPSSFGLSGLTGIFR